MIKRTLYFGNNAYLHTKDEQLLIDFADKNKESAKVAIEDIGVIIGDLKPGPQIWWHDFCTVGLLESFQVT